MAVGTYALTSVANVQAFLGSQAGQYEQAQIELAIDAVTAAVEDFLDRHVRERMWTEIYDGTGDQYQYLREYPVTSVARLAFQRDLVLRISNSTSDAVAASVEAISTGLTLTIVGGGSAGSSAVTFAANATLTLLAAAINALGLGWSATVETDFGAWPSAGLFPQPAQDAKSPAEARLVMWTDYESDYEYGRHGMLYRATGFPAGIRNVYVVYTAGESATPPGLQLTVHRIIADVLAATRSAGLLSERLGDYSYTLADNAAAIVSKYAAELKPHRRLAA